MKMSHPLVEQIKSEIARLHKRNSANYETLINQIENERSRRRVTLNLPQLVAAMARQRTLVLEWGRGTGKTTMRGYRWSQMLSEMPRSTGLFIGPTYQFILTRIVPSLVQGLEMFGIYKDLHYFIGSQPPRSWRKSWQRAYQVPEKTDRYISFWNGMGVHLISQDVPGDGRGLNADWIDADEAALLNYELIQTNNDPTLRGTNVRELKGSYLFGSRFFSSSTPLTPEGQWLIGYEEKAKLSPGKVAFISATCEHNAANLREGYLQEAEENALARWIFEAEYHNKRPNFVKDSFYTLLDVKRHCYTNFNYDHYQHIGQAIDCRGDGDLVRGIPIILGVDWGATINCLTVNQYVRSLNEYRTLKSMYVLGDAKQTQDDLFNDFCEYYQYHEPRELEMWYDNTGNQRTGNTSRTRAEQARDLLARRGWKVRLMTSGTTNPMHGLKHLLWEAIFKEEDPQLPRYRMNKENARELYISMRNAKAITGRFGETKKDKSLERSGRIPRQEATDLSDANDTAVFGRFYSLLRFKNSMLPDPRITRG